MDGKFFQVPENVMVQIIKLINNLPYGQVAPLANAITKIVTEQQEVQNLTDEGT